MGIKGEGIRDSLRVNLEPIPEKWRGHVETFLARFDAKFPIRTAILYGSRATGTYQPHSDIDIVVISEEVIADFLGRLRAISDLYLPGAPIEALAYTSSEFHRMIDDMHVTALDATTQGVPLVNPEQFLVFRAHTARLESEGLRRGKHSWVMDAPKR